MCSLNGLRWGLRRFRQRVLCAIFQRVLLLSLSPPLPRGFSHLCFAAALALALPLAVALAQILVALPSPLAGKADALPGNHQC